MLRDVTWLEKPGNRVQFLGRSITRVEGFDLAVNRRLAEEIIGDAGTLGRRSCAVPGSKERVRDCTEVDARDHAYYRMQTGRLIFFVQYRADMQFAVGQLSRHVSNPKVWNMVALKRCIRYLASALTHHLELRPVPGDITVDEYSDADWASLEDRKSVSCGALQVNGALASSYSRTQAVVAQSSCESELHGLGSAATEALWVAGLLKEAFGVDVVPTIWGDSTSALSLASRAGMGRLKHVEIRLLAIQDWVRQRRLRLAKVDTVNNLSSAPAPHATRQSKNSFNKSAIHGW